MNHILSKDELDGWIEFGIGYTESQIYLNRFSELKKELEKLTEKYNNEYIIFALPADKTIGEFVREFF